MHKKSIKITELDGLLGFIVHSRKCNTFDQIARPYIDLVCIRIMLLIQEANLTENMYFAIDPMDEWKVQ